MHILLSSATSGEAKKTILRFKAQSPNVTCIGTSYHHLETEATLQDNFIHLPLFENTLEDKKSVLFWVFLTRGRPDDTSSLGSFFSLCHLYTKTTASSSPIDVCTLYK